MLRLARGMAEFTGGVAGELSLDLMCLMRKTRLRKVVVAEAHRGYLETIVQVGALRVDHHMTAHASPTVELLLDFAAGSLAGTGDSRSGTDIDLHLS